MRNEQYLEVVINTLITIRDVTTVFVVLLFEPTLYFTLYRNLKLRSITLIKLNPLERLYPKTSPKKYVAKNTRSETKNKPKRKHNAL